MLRGRMGFSDGRRARPSQALPLLHKMPFTQAQKSTMDQRAFVLEQGSPWVHPDISFFNPPADAYTFRRTSEPAASYPQPGQSAVTVLSYTVPPSMFCCINALSIVPIGGNDPSFTGQVIWRVLKNSAGLRGLNQLTAAVGTFAQPKSVVIVGIENDTFVVTVEVPSTWPAMPGNATTVASFDGFLYPLSEATRPRKGNY